MPTITKIAIAIASCINQYYLKVIGGCCILIIISNALYATKGKFYTYIHLKTIKLPIIGAITQKIIIYKCFHNIAIALKAGIPLQQAIQLVAALTNNPQYKIAFLQIQKLISLGYSLHYALAKTNLFPEITIKMILFSEETGKLDDMLYKIATIFEEETANFFDKIMLLLEPSLILILGIIIGFLVIAVYLPFINLGLLI